MLSAADQWDVQAVISQIVAELQHRQYLVWFDRELYTQALARAVASANARVR